jgi:hypothetical protein
VGHQRVSRRFGRRFLHLLLPAAALIFPYGAFAEPWTAPGDSGLRHDVQLLSDAGLLAGPYLSWPVGWNELAKQLSLAGDPDLSVAQAQALARVRARAAREMEPDEVDLQVRLSAAVEPIIVRNFEDSPREEAEAWVSVAAQGERWAGKLRLGAVASPDDDQQVRADGSYVGVMIGNWLMSAGFTERWWGPGWQGSLILSTAARPVPAIAVDRLNSDPFDFPVLRWLGPWKLSAFMGQLESDREYPDALLFGLRMEMRPHPTLQLGLSRTAQWCGEGRPCGLDTFWDLLVGNDNQEDLGEQPGNQLAGFDLRWTWPGGRVPVAVYAQGIGEDEAGGLPSKYIGLFGLEFWGGIGDASFRAYAEYSDTACDFTSSLPEFGCAYTNVIYTDGYRYRGRAIGHSIDADGESLALGAVVVDGNGSEWLGRASNIKLNRAGLSVGHTLSDGAARMREISLEHVRSIGWGRLKIGAGYLDTDLQPGARTVLDEGLRGYLDWQMNWH